MVDDRRQSLLQSFAAHRDALLRFLARKLDDRSLAEDFTQETWLRAANSPGGAAIGNPRSYLFRIASNLVLDHKRRVGQPRRSSCCVGERAGSDRARNGLRRRIGSGRSWQIAFHPSRQ